VDIEPLTFAVSRKERNEGEMMNAERGMMK
jgi:hypothetical protein